MTYYLLLKGDTEKDVMFETNQGMVALNNIVNRKPKLIETIKILDDYKKSYTLTEFFDILSKLKIKST